MSAGLIDISMCNPQNNADPVCWTKGATRSDSKSSIIAEDFPSAEGWSIWKQQRSGHREEGHTAWLYQKGLLLRMRSRASEFEKRQKDSFCRKEKQQMRRTEILHLEMAIAVMLLMIISGVSAYVVTDPPVEGGYKYAVIVGISDYRNYVYEDAHYCDDDAADWARFLGSLGYTHHLLGGADDPHPGGIATEEAIRASIDHFASIAVAGDTFVFVASGHGGRVISDCVYFCTYEYSGLKGRYYGFELRGDIDDFKPGVKIFVFFDSCNSGGMCTALEQSLRRSYIYCTTACDSAEESQESPSFRNGVWTYYFLERNLAPNPERNLEYCFSQAYSQYTEGWDSTPQAFDGDTCISFRL